MRRISENDCLSLCVLDILAPIKHISTLKVLLPPFSWLITFNTGATHVYQLSCSGVIQQHNIHTMLAAYVCNLCVKPAYNTTNFC